MIKESVRISKGNVLPLKKLYVLDYDAVFIPGGLGSTRNFANFCGNGDFLIVNNEIERVLKECKWFGRYIGLSGISPILAAKVF